jgi:hypothetical protein
MGGKAAETFLLVMDRFPGNGSLIHRMASVGDDTLGAENLAFMKLHARYLFPLTPETVTNQSQQVVAYKLFTNRCMMPFRESRRNVERNLKGCNQRTVSMRSQTEET